MDFETGNVTKKVVIELDSYSVLPNANQLTQEQKELMLNRIGNPFDALQMAGLFDGNGIFYQGTKLGIIKIFSSDNKKRKQ